MLSQESVSPQPTKIWLDCIYRRNPTPTIINKFWDYAKQRLETTEEPFEPYALVQSESGSIKKWNNLQDQEQRFRQISRYAVTEDMDVYENSIDAEIQYIANSTMKLCDTRGEEVSKNIRFSAFDLELGSNFPGSGFSMDTAIENPVLPVRCVSVYWGVEDGMRLSFVYEPVPQADQIGRIVQCKDEEELLSKVLNLLKYKIGIIVGFNSREFDIPYMIARARLLGDTKANEYGPSIHLDLYDVFSVPAIKGYMLDNAYDRDTLEAVAEALLPPDLHKSHVDFQTVEIDDLLRYNIQDTRVTWHLAKEILDPLLYLCNIANCPLRLVQQRGISFWYTAALYVAHVKQGILFPRSFCQAPEEGDKKYTPKGGINLQPIKGIHHNVAVVDFAGMYPGIISQFNVSYETINCGHPDCMINAVPCTPAGQSIYVCTKRDGFLSKFVGNLRMLRINYWKPRKDKFSKRCSGVLKVFVNGGFGVFGSSVFLLYKPELMDAITSYGRHMLITTDKAAQEFGMERVYGVTDSLFVKNHTPESIKSLIAFAEEQFKIQLELDKIYLTLALSSRKNAYFGITTKGELSTKGLAGQRSNMPAVIVESFDRILDFIKTEHNNPNLITLLKAKVLKESVIIRKPQNLEKFVFYAKIKEQKKNKPIWLNAYEQLTAEEKGRYKTGDDFGFVRIKKRNNITVAPVLHAKIEQLDIAEYESLFKNALAQLLDPFDLDYTIIVTGQRKVEDYGKPKIK